MYIKFMGYKIELLSFVWSFYLIMIMCLTTAIPHIQMISIFILVGATLVYVLKKKGMIVPMSVFPFVVWYIIFIGYVLMSRFWAIRYWDSNIPDTCRRIIIDIICMMIYLDSYEKTVEMAYKFIIAAVIMDILFILTSDPSMWGSDHVICGITGMHRNNLGCVSAFSVILSMWLIQNHKEYKNLKYAIPLLILGTLFSGSRTNMIVIIMAIMMFTLLQDNIKRRAKMILLGVLVIMVVIMVLSTMDFSSEFSKKYLYRIFAIFDENYSDSSMDYRTILKMTAFQLIQQRPIFGNGLEATAAYNASIGLEGISAHSNYYELWACYGLVGLAIYYSMYVYLIIKGYLERKNVPGRKLSFIVFTILAITEYQTFHEFEYFGVFLYMIVFSIAVYSPHAGEEAMKNEGKKFK